MKENIEGALKLASKLKKPWHIITVIILVLLSGLVAVFLAKGHRINSPDISQHIENINSPTHNTTNMTIIHLQPSPNADSLPSNMKANTQHPNIVAESEHKPEKKTKSAISSDLEAVQDKHNQIIWQKNIQGQLLTWTRAQEYCKSLELGGYSDWRLPTIDELASLTDKRYSPSINPLFGTLPANYPPYFWSDTIDPNDNNEVQFLNFKNGLSAHIKKEKGHGFVRCVRQM